MLYKVDRSSMACSLEVRVPYLDNEVLEYALALPFAQKSNDRFRNKALLKELLLQLAPHYDVNKPKKGFGFPLKKWLKENWKDHVLSMMNANEMHILGLEPRKYIGIVDDFYKKDTPYYTDIWYIFNLMLWLNSFKKIQSVWTT
jgi:asparagine synthetase B (glutamine-hydrolysing)